MVVAWYGRSVGSVLVKKRWRSWPRCYHHHLVWRFWSILLTNLGYYRIGLQYQSYWIQAITYGGVVRTQRRVRVGDKAWDGGALAHVTITYHHHFEQCVVDLSLYCTPTIHCIPSSCVGESQVFSEHRSVKTVARETWNLGVFLDKKNSQTKSCSRRPGWQPVKWQTVARVTLKFRYWNFNSVVFHRLVIQFIQ